MKGDEAEYRHVLTLGQKIALGGIVWARAEWLRPLGARAAIAYVILMTALLSVLILELAIAIVVRFGDVAALAYLVVVGLPWLSLVLSWGSCRPRLLLALGKVDAEAFAALDPRRSQPTVPPPADTTSVVTPEIQKKPSRALPRNEESDQETGGDPRDAEDWKRHAE